MRPPSARWTACKVCEEERVPETVDVQKSMESMIQLDGAKIIFPTSFGYFDPHVLEMAKKYPDVMFLHCGGLWNEKRTSEKRGQLLRLHRRVPVPQRHRRRSHDEVEKARLRRRQADSASAAQHQRLHARRAQRRPDDHLPVIFTGDWSMPVKEAEATNSLIDQGVDVITCHVDSPKVVVENAENARHLHLRLPLQPGDARTEGLSHRRRVELGKGLHRLHQAVSGRHRSFRIWSAAD